MADFLPEGLEKLKASAVPHEQRELVMTAKRARACELRTEGHDYNYIGHELGVSPAYARVLVKDALQLTTSEAVEDMRLLDGARLEAVIKVIWPRVMAGDLRAIDRLILLMERKSRLYGLDQPIEINIVEMRTHLFGILRDVLDPADYERVLQAASE